MPSSLALCRVFEKVFRKCFKSLRKLLKLNKSLKNLFYLLAYQKCLDKDPAKRWSCEKLIKHSYFDDYIAKQRELESLNSLEAATLRQQQQLLQQHMLQQQQQQAQQSLLQTSQAAAQAAAVAATNVASRDKSKVSKDGKENYVRNSL